jgi:type II secretory pathway pseudopilin PulG
MVIAITILSLLLAGAAIVFVFGLKAVERLTDEVKYLENIIDAKNDALTYYVDAYQDSLDELVKLRISTATKKPVGRPKGSKNKVTKPKFDKQKFNDKYGK